MSPVQEVVHGPGFLVRELTQKGGAHILQDCVDPELHKVVGPIHQEFKVSQRFVDALDELVNVDGGPGQFDDAGLQGVGYPLNVRVHQILKGRGDLGTHSTVLSQQQL